jgi:hypothetical protein
MGICFQGFSFFLTLAFDLSVQLTATLLHVLACAEPSDFSALRDPLIKVGSPPDISSSGRWFIDRLGRFLVVERGGWCFLNTSEPCCPSAACRKKMLTEDSIFLMHEHSAK